MATSRRSGLTGLVSVPGFYTSACLQKGVVRQVGEHPLARRDRGAAAHAGDELRAVPQLEPDLRVVTEVHDTADARGYRVFGPPEPRATRSGRISSRTVSPVCSVRS